jgi:hypothetical protein
MGINRNFLEIHRLAGTTFAPALIAYHCQKRICYDAHCSHDRNGRIYMTFDVTRIRLCGHGNRVLAADGDIMPGYPQLAEKT